MPLAHVSLMELVCNSSFDERIWHFSCGGKYTRFTYKSYPSICSTKWKDNKLVTLVKNWGEFRTRDKFAELILRKLWRINIVFLSSSIKIEHFLLSTTTLIHAHFFFYVIISILDSTVRLKMFFLIFLYQFGNVSDY